MAQSKHESKFGTKSFQDLDKTITIQSYEDFLDFLSWSARSKEQMFFRGQQDAKWDLMSTWLRKEKKDIEKTDHDISLLRKILQKEFKNRIERIRFGYHFQTMTDLEILSQLRHNKIDSPLIDFSSNALTALWFAVRQLKYSKEKDSTHDAKLFIISHTEKIFFDIKDWEKKDAIFSSPKIIDRSIAQNSYFIFDNDYWRNQIENKSQESKIKEIVISSSAVEEIRKHLSSINISNYSIFPDLEGAFLDQDSYTAEGYFSLAYNKQILHESNSVSDLEKLEPTLYQIIGLYDKAIAINPNFADYYFNKGIALSRLGKHQKAIEMYDKAIALNPNFVKAYLAKGSALHSLDEYLEAIEMYDKAIALNPNFTEAYNAKGIVLNYLGKHDDALMMLDKAIAVNPNFPDAYNSKGIVLKSLGNHKEAMKSYDKAIEINPNFVEAYINRGNIFAIQGKYEKAIQMFDKAIGINPNFAGAYVSKGAALNSIEKHQEAIETCNKAIEINPKFALAYLIKANAFYLLGKKQECLEIVNKVLSLEPNNKDALEYKKRLDDEDKK